MVGVSGKRLRIEGKGEPGKNAPAGNLYVVVHVKEHPSLERKNENLLVEEKIDLSTAIFGGELFIDGIDRKIKVKISAGTQSNSLLRLEKQGFILLIVRRHI